MVIDPLRAGPLLAAAVNVTLPDPLPPELLPAVSHGVDDVTLHAQPERVVTLNESEPPPAATSDGPDTVNWQGAASCVTDITASLTLTLPWRPLAAGLAA